MWPRSDWFLGHAKMSFRKIVLQVVIRDASGRWQDLYIVTSIRIIQKNTKNGQKCGNKLASGWQNVQGSKQREFELISQKIWGKRKGKMFRLRRWLLLHVKQHESCCWRTFVIRKYNIIWEDIATSCWSIWSMMMKRLCTYWSTTTKENSLKKPTSKRKLFKK